jgi:hypothetical protein
VLILVTAELAAIIAQYRLDHRACLLELGSASLLSNCTTVSSSLLALSSQAEGPADP